MGEFLTVGYAAIDKISSKEYFGGAAAGIAINGKKLGVNTGLLALFGDDKRSKRYLKHLSDLEIDLSQSVEFSKVGLPVNDLSHDNISGWDDKLISMMIPSVTLSTNGLNSYELVHLASPHPGLVEKVVQTKTKGILTYTPGPLITVNDHNLNITALKASTVLFLNEHEWAVVKRKFNIKNPDDLIDFGPNVIVTTLGEKGAEIFHRNKSKPEKISIAPTFISDAETTGAGDAFSLGFLYGFIQGLTLEQCGMMGTKLATCAVQKNGVIIDEKKLLQFRKELT